DGEPGEARVGATAGGDERDVQLVVEILATQESRCARDDTGGGQRAADKLAACHPALAYLPRRLLHGSAPCVNLEPIRVFSRIREATATGFPAGRKTAS